MSSRLDVFLLVTPSDPRQEKEVEKIDLQSLKKKWTTIPLGKFERQGTPQLSQLDDDALLEKWRRAHKESTQTRFENRGWYQTLYRDSFQSKTLLDVGSGFGLDGLFFAQNGVNVTFLDLSETNLNLIERLAKKLRVGDRVQFFHMDEVPSLKHLKGPFDVIWANGSLHHAPMDFLKQEVTFLLENLKVGGRWIQLAYPKSRWEREGSKSFDAWGANTDGTGTPWAEWYDLDKIFQLLDKGIFDLVFQQEFQNSDFIWFDLLYRGPRRETS